MRRLFLYGICGTAAVATLFFAAACSRSQTGSAKLDEVFTADYGTWGQLVLSNKEVYEKELRNINPHYEAGRRESITNTPQKIVLSLLAMKKKDGVIVELGAWTGGGALLMAPYLTHDKSYHAVDTFNADTMTDVYIQAQLKGKKHLDVFKKNTGPIESKIVIHQGWTNDVAATWPKDLIVDLLFIDAGHTYEDVSNDWKNWSPFVRKGGLVVFHDYYVKNENGHPGVRKFVDGSITGRIAKNIYSIEGLAWYVVE